jgi:hypothetical protein
MRVKTLKSMKNIDLDDLCDALLACFRHARRVLANNVLSYSYTTELAEYVETIRMLLQNLEQASRTLGNAPCQAATIIRLRDNFEDLEGIVKERRNDLNRTLPGKISRNR